MSEGLSSARAAAVTAKGKPSREVEVEPGADPDLLKERETEEGGSWVELFEAQQSSHLILDLNVL